MKKLFTEKNEWPITRLIMAAIDEYEDSGRTSSAEQIFKELKKLSSDEENHPWDCKCVLHR